MLDNQEEVRNKRKIKEKYSIVKVKSKNVNN